MATSKERNSGSHAKREAAEPCAETRRRRSDTGNRAPEKRKGASADTPRRKSAPRTQTKRDRFEEELEARPAPRRGAKKKKRRAMRRLSAILIILVSLVLAAGCGTLYAGSVVSNSETNLPGVYLDGIDLGGLTKEETRARLSAQGWDRAAQIPLQVTLPAGISFELDRLESGAEMPLDKAVEAVFAYGHSGSWLADLKSYVQSYMNPVDLGGFSATLDEAYIARQVQGGVDAFAERTGGAGGYVLDKEASALVMVKGAGQVRVDADKLSAAVRQALLAGEDSLRYDELEDLPPVPDFEEIYRQLAAEPLDAHYTETWDVVDEVVGCTFGIEEAVSLWDNTPWLEKVSVPVTITYPSVTGEALRAALYRDLLGTQTTYFPNSVQNRVSNIALAASKLDGIIMLPGDSLSYNDTIGQRTLEAGFLEAGAYADGEVVEEIGGGICQVSSTLYCAEVMANLETVNRTNHYFRVDYLPIGFDATVSWGGPEFVFRNNRDYPIKIVTYCDSWERYVTVEIWGTNVDGTHVEMRNDGVWTIYDSEYTATAIGTATTTYRDIYDAEGNLIETVKERYSDYHKHPEDIDWPPEKYAADAAAATGEATVITVG